MARGACSGCSRRLGLGGGAVGGLGGRRSRLLLLDRLGGLGRGVGGGGRGLGRPAGTGVPVLVGARSGRASDGHDRHRTAAVGTVCGLAAAGIVSAVSAAAATVRIDSTASGAAPACRAARGHRAWRAGSRGLVLGSAKPNRGCDWRVPAGHAAARATGLEIKSLYRPPQRETSVARRHRLRRVQGAMHDLTLESRVRDRPAEWLLGAMRDAMDDRLPCRRWPPPSTTRASSTAFPGRARRRSARSPRS